MPSNDTQWREYNRDCSVIRQCIPMDYSDLDQVRDAMGQEESDAWETVLGARVDRDALYRIAYHAANRGYQLGLSRSWGE